MQGRMDLAAALRFPLTKLFGDSSTGFGGGQDAQENYNSVVSGMREGAEPILLEVAGLRCQQRFGFLPEDLSLEWKPLREMDGPDEAQVQEAKSKRVLDYFDRDLMDGKEASEQLRNDGNLTVETAVLRGDREVLPPMQQEHELGMEAQDAAGQTQLKLAKAKGTNRPAQRR
jgi:hypothetical protein